MGKRCGDDLSSERREELRASGLLPSTPRQKRRMVTCSVVGFICQVTNLVLLYSHANDAPIGFTTFLALDVVTMLMFFLLSRWSRQP